MPTTSNTAGPAGPREGEFLRLFLGGRDVACPVCGYNLRELAGTRCPECGEELVLKVSPAEPKLAPLLLGIAALAAGAGFSGLLLILVAVMGGDVPGDQILVLVFGFVVEGATLALWVKSWRRVRTMPPWRQSLAVLGCMALTAANVFAFIKRVR